MKSNRKSVVVYLLVVVLSVLFILVGNKVSRPEIMDQEAEEYFKAEVTAVSEVQIEEIQLDELNSAENKTVRFTARITSGAHKSETVEATQNINAMYAVQPKPVEVGGRVIVSQLHFGGAEEREWTFIEHNRSDTLIWLSVIFLLLILVIGRKKGFSTILSLVLTVLAVFAVFIPSILKGYNVYLSTVVVGVFIVLMSLLLLNGANKKTACAIAGNIGGMAIAGVIAVVTSKLLHMTGVVDEDYVFLMSAQLEQPIDLVALIWSGIVIGALGAIMDVAMSIASAMNELAENMTEKTFGRLLKSGMTIGRDAIGTMTNTLILAYVGSSLATVLLLIVYNKDLLFLFNLEMITVEVLQSVVGSMGILFAVPVTALFSAYAYTRQTGGKDGSE